MTQPAAEVATDELSARIDCTCPDCGTHVRADGVAHGDVDFGTDMLPTVEAEWDCPACGSGHSEETPFDVDLFDQCDFHSWVGTIGDDRACIIVEDDMGPSS